jgi:GH24 family phage-related lysozyme (muramidase)
MQKIHAKEELPKTDARQKQLWTNHWLYLHKTGIFVSSDQNENKKNALLSTSVNSGSQNCDRNSKTKMNTVHKYICVMHAYLFSLAKKLGFISVDI